jgi:hypothetical protein
LNSNEELSVMFRNLELLTFSLEQPSNQFSSFPRLTHWLNKHVAALAKACHSYIPYSGYF